MHHLGEYSRRFWGICLWFWWWYYAIDWIVERLDLGVQASSAAWDTRFVVAAVVTLIVMAVSYVLGWFAEKRFGTTIPPDTLVLAISVGLLVGIFGILVVGRG